MKTSIYFFLAILVLGFTACEGPVGPQGPEGQRGPEGPAGPNILPYTVEYIFDYNYSNEKFDVFFDLPIEEDNPGYELYESDIVLAYLLIGTDDTDGTERDIWQAMPLTRFTEGGTLIYNYDFTTTTLRLFIDSNYEPSIPNENLFEDWVVRFVVVPAEFAELNRADVNYNDYYSVAEHFNLEVEPVDKKYSSIKRSFQ